MVFKEISLLSLCQNSQNIVKFYHYWIEFDEFESEEKFLSKINFKLLKNKEDIINYILKTSKKIRVYIQMEFCEKTLENLIFTLKNESMKKRLELCKEIIIASKYIHSLGIIHRDIKTSNILIKNNKIKLADFGLSTFINNENKYDSKIFGLNYHSQGIGTGTYCSPEQINSHIYNEKTDIYSLGLILYEILQPYKCIMEKYENFNSLKKFNKIPNEKFENKYPDLSKNILNMLKIEYNQRPKEEEILNVINSELDKINFIENISYYRKGRKYSENDFSLNTIIKLNDCLQENNKINFSYGEIEDKSNYKYVLYFDNFNDEKKDVNLFDNNYLDDYCNINLHI